MSGYIGVQPVPQATQTRDVFTATAGQTSFATSGYTPGYVQVYLNGVKLIDGTDFTASNGSDVVLATGATLNDTVEVLSFSTFETGDFVSTSGGTFFGAVSFDADVTPDSDATYDLGSSSKAWAEVHVGGLYLPEQASAPSTGANEGAVYTKESGGQSELFYREESDGDEVQITNGGILNATPSGSVTWFAANNPPTGWLECDGSAISRTTYAALFSAIGTTFGVGDGSTTFDLPDLRGEFIRGWDNGRGVDSGRAFGSAQSHALDDHYHTSSYELDGQILPFGSNGPYSVMSRSGTAYNGVQTSTAVGATTGTETRPRNIALLPIIKY